MNMHREETVCFLVKLANDVKRGSLLKLKAKEEGTGLDKFAFGVIAPPMVATPYDGRTTLIFGDYRKPTMATDIVKSSNGTVLRKNQEDWVRPNIVFIVSAHLSESSVMRKTMPCL